MRTEETVSSMLCPVCRTGLSMSDRSGVEIDFCPSCRGVWLDRGELDKIIERTSIAMAQEPERTRSPDRQAGPGGLMGMAASMLQGDDDRYDKHRGDRYDDRYDNRRPKKKKSLLSEFFD